jgi:hypothetical protein
LVFRGGVAARLVRGKRSMKGNRSPRTAPALGKRAKERREWLVSRLEITREINDL